MGVVETVAAALLVKVPRMVARVVPVERRAFVHEAWVPTSSSRPGIRGEGGGLTESGSSVEDGALHAGPQVDGQ